MSTFCELFPDSYMHCSVSIGIHICQICWRAVVKASWLWHIMRYYQHMYGALRCINSQTHRPPESRKTHSAQALLYSDLVANGEESDQLLDQVERHGRFTVPLQSNQIFMFQCSRSYGLRFDLILVIVKDCWGLLRFIYYILLYIKVCWICAHNLPPRNPSHTTTATTGWCRRLQIPEPSPWMGPELVVNLIFSFGESSLVNLVVLSRNNQLWLQGFGGCLLRHLREFDAWKHASRGLQPSGGDDGPKINGRRCGLGHLVNLCKFSPPNLDVDVELSCFLLLKRTAIQLQVDSYMGLWTEPLGNLDITLPQWEDSEVEGPPGDQNGQPFQAFHRPQSAAAGTGASTRMSSFRRASKLIGSITGCPYKLFSLWNWTTDPVCLRMCIGLLELSDKSLGCLKYSNCDQEGKQLQCRREGSVWISEL